MGRWRKLTQVNKDIEKRKMASPDSLPLALPRSAELEKLGEEAYMQSSIYRELYETFKFPAFRCLMDKLKDPAVSEATQMFINVYANIDENKEISDLEKLGMLKSIMDTSSTRQEIIRLSKEGKLPGLTASRQGRITSSSPPPSSPFSS